MSGFISLIMDVLSIQLTLGSHTFSLGSLLGMLLILRIGYNRLFAELSMSSIDRWEEKADDIIIRDRKATADDFYQRMSNSEKDEHGWFDGQNF